MTKEEYEQSMENWRSKRLSRLAAEDGWLNIIGRWELELGSVRLGAAEDNDIVFASGPDHIGSLIGDRNEVIFKPADGSDAMRLTLDKRNPPRFSVGQLLLEVTTLNGRSALRLRDTSSTAREALPEIPYFPIDPEWRVVADWVALSTPLTAMIDTMIGIPTEVTITHKAMFTRDGKAYQLLPTHGTPQSPQFVIRDQTATAETYAASRFLFGEDITETSIVLDFNKAINPPCAFTEFAVCPLPLPQNILPFRVEAGERKLIE